MFADLEERQPEGFTYKVFRLDDGVSFIHVVIEHDIDQPDSLQAVPAFQAFVAGIADRCDVPPVRDRRNHRRWLPLTCTPEPRLSHSRWLRSIGLIDSMDGTSDRVSSPGATSVRSQLRGHASPARPLPAGHRNDDRGRGAPRVELPRPAHHGSVEQSR